MKSFMLITRTNVKSGPCHRCSIIRSFVLFTFMLIILALVGGDRLAVIDFLTPTWFATFIILIGISGFLFKLISWKIFNKRI
jgi:protein-S-isoprenylcysteine O-methyltransferase Ste14